MAANVPNPEDLWQSTLHWHPNQDQQRLFQALFEALIDTNKTVNLTRITTPEAFWEKHLWDSLQGIAPWLSQCATEGTEVRIQPLNTRDPLTVIDIGTGGGFPGLPVAVAHSNWQISLMDSTRKKVTAIQAIVEALGLNNVSLLAERAEHVGHQPIYREAFDLALIRAVGSTNTCAEYALPLVKPGGYAILYRGNWATKEEIQLKAILPQLGGKLLRVRKSETPLTYGNRHYIDLLKVERTPDKFPRAAGIPAKTPLQGP